MRSTIAFAALLLLLWVSPVIMGQLPEQATPASPVSQQEGRKDQSEYRQLVERVKQGDQTVDFVRLRAAYAKWQCDKTVNTDSPNRDAMVAAFNEKNYAKAVDLVEAVLDFEFPHVGLHRAAEEAYRELNNQSKADLHKTIADKLVNALLASGDGKTAETAYQVLTIREEYFIMNQLGYKVSSQALMSGRGKSYDVLSGRDSKTNKEVSVYFDISSFFGGCK
jgi:hypothetical protein